jgi:transcriptional regulator with XRE-family HTH domain
MKLRGLRQARQRSGLSIGQLAELTGLRRDTVTHLEHGKEEPQSYAVRRLATALGASVADLYGLPVLEYPDPPSPERRGRLPAAG